MGKPSDHITPGALCTCCGRLPADTLARFVIRQDVMNQDAMLWAGATCEHCARLLAGAVEGMWERLRRVHGVR